MVRHLVLVLVLALASSVLLASPGFAQEVESDQPAEAVAMIGPMVGAPAPSLEGVETIEPDAVPATPTDAGLALVFVRSADWCPYCKTQLGELNDAVAPLAAAGWRLSAISYDSPALLEAFSKDQALDFALLSDPGSEVIRAFNLLNEDMKPSSRAYGIPHPAVVFIRADGTVGAVLREEGFKTRPTVESVVDTAMLLNEAATGL
ncbi:MAG: peroxiredoxin family protein [Pseudomonadota bacterium]